MVAPIELAYTAPVALSPITNLNSLLDGNIWHSGEYNDPSPSNQAIRISYSIVLGAAFASDDRIDFWIAKGDEAASNEIWDGGISTSEGRITTAGSIAAALSALGTPVHSPPFEADISTTLTGSFDVWDFGPSWQLCIRVVSNTIAASGSVVRYRYITPAMSTDFETTVSITKDATNAVPRTLQEYIDDTVFSPEDFGGVAAESGTHTVAFQRAIAAAALTNGIIGIPAGTWALDANMTMQGVIMGYNTIISPVAGRTITIGTIQAPCNTQLFAGDGSIQVTVTRPIYAEWFGAVANNVVDSTQPIIKAANCQQANRAWVQLLAGDYKTTGMLDIAVNGIRFWGAGRSQTTIRSNNGTAHDVMITTIQPVDVGYFQYAPAVSKAGGSALLYITSPPGASNPSTNVHDITFANGVRGLYMDRGLIWRVEHCYFANCTTEFEIANLTVGDAGDSHITGCVFHNSNKTGTQGILYRSSGGLKLTNCKFLEHQIQFLLSPDNGVATSILLVNGCSFESAGTIGIQLTRTAGFTGIFGYIVITGCQFNNHGSAAINIPSGIPGTMDNLVVTGNMINMPAGATGVSIGHGEGHLIDSNVFQGQGATTGLTVGAAATGRGSNNVFRTVSTPVSNNSTSFIYDPEILRATAIWNPASMNAGTTTSTTITVTGAVVGDPVTASLTTLTTQNTMISAMVSAVDTVLVRLKNEDSVSVDIPSGTLKVVVHHML